MRVFVLLFSVALFLSCKGSGTGGSTSTTFTTSSTLKIEAPSSVVGTNLLIGKFTKDDYADIVLLTQSEAYLYKNQTANSFTSSSIAAGEFSVGLAYDMDLDDDSLLDLILNEQNVGLRIYRNSVGTLAATGAFHPSTNEIAWLAYAQKKPTTSNNDQGYVFAAAETTSHYSVRQNALNSFQSASNHSSDVSVESGVKVHASDLDGDGYTDFVLIPKSGNKRIVFYKNDSDTQLVETNTLIRESTAQILESAVGDLDDDGKKDIILLNSSGSEVYSQSSDFSFTLNSQVTSSSIASGRSMVVGDFTGDGLLDVVVARSNGTSKFYSQTSAMTFTDISSTAFANAQLESGAVRVYAADMNNDETLDLIELFSNGAVTIHLNALNQ